MKALIILAISCCVTINAFSQTWQSIPTSYYGFVPSKQFIIDPFRNSIWMHNDNEVAVIESDGALFNFDDVQLGNLYSGIDLSFAFTLNDIFYSKQGYGLYGFTGYSSQFKYSDTETNGITANNDTVYLYRSGYSFIKFLGGAILTNHYAPHFVAKNEYLYADNGSNTNITYYYGPNTLDYASLNSDPQYLGGVFNEMKFSRLSDTLYVGSKQGISFAYNYDFLDTLTPYNTTNMPSPNVLEMEFDHEDKLWAVFGDINDMPFAIAKLENMIWTNIIDAGNSPINFNNFFGMEIDTLGNLWVVDNLALHTLLTPNSPQWLGNVELKSDAVNFEIFPNPANNFVEIKVAENEAFTLQITDIQGKIVLEKDISFMQNTIEIKDWNAGVYLVKITDSNGNTGIKRLVKN